MPRVLVVDDSPVDRRLAAGLLTRGGDWEVEQAEDGAQALRAIEAHTPDLVLTDMTMPELNGLELVSEVARRHRKLPVILMTALGSEDIAVEALQLGAASYVTKKRLALDLVEIVNRVMSAADDARTQTRVASRLETLSCRFLLPNELAEVLALPNHLQRIAESAGWNIEGESVRMCVALEEALLNALFHGNLEIDSRLKEEDHAAFYELADERKCLPPYCDRRIHVEVHFSPEEARYVIRDEGSGFDHAALPDPTDPSNLDRPSGRGLLLMSTFMDEVRHNAAGNEVTLVKRRSGEM